VGRGERSREKIKKAGLEITRALLYTARKKGWVKAGVSKASRKDRIEGIAFTSH